MQPNLNEEEGNFIINQDPDGSSPDVGDYNTYITSQVQVTAAALGISPEALTYQDLLFSLLEEESLKDKIHAFLGQPVREPRTLASTRRCVCE